MAKRKPDTGAIYISPRLRASLEPVGRCALTVVTAPMGYGKTTAVNWFLGTQPPGCAIRISIYSDSLPALWQSGRRAFRDAGLTALEGFECPGDPASAGLLADTLCRELRRQEPWYVFLDDLHLMPDRRVALDLSECTRVAIPREQRPTDYDALLDQIYAAVGAIDNRMALRTLRARYSETGSLTSLEMTVWSLQEETYSLNSWADVHVSVQRSGSGFTVTAQDQHRPLPMDSETVAAMLSVQRFVETVKAVDSADLWTSQKTGQPLYYQLTYHASEYEAAVAADGGVPCLNPDGSAAQLPQGSLLVLAQCYDRGDANIALTDSQGLTTGALRVIVPAA